MFKYNKICANFLIQPIWSHCEANNLQACAALYSKKYLRGQIAKGVTQVKVRKDSATE